MRLVSLLSLTCLLVMPGCGDSGSDSPASPSANVPFTTTDLTVGNGATATPGSRVAVNYIGWLYDAGAPENKGQQFDSGQGFQFVLGSGQVIPGWDQGVEGMRVGGTRRLVIPPPLAYGDRQVGPIPPNSTLVFDVELVNVQ